MTREHEPIDYVRTLFARVDALASLDRDEPPDPDEIRSSYEHLRAMALASIALDLRDIATALQQREDREREQAEEIREALRRREQGAGRAVPMPTTDEWLEGAGAPVEDAVARGREAAEEQLSSRHRADHDPSIRSIDVPCGALPRTGAGYACTRPHGHGGSHSNAAGERWGDGDEFERRTRRRGDDAD